MYNLSNLWKFKSIIKCQMHICIENFWPVIQLISYLRGIWCIYRHSSKHTPLDLLTAYPVHWPSLWANICLSWQNTVLSIRSFDANINLSPVTFRQWCGSYRCFCKVLLTKDVSHCPFIFFSVKITHLYRWPFTNNHCSTLLNFEVDSLRNMNPTLDLISLI